MHSFDQMHHRFTPGRDERARTTKNLPRPEPNPVYLETAHETPRREEDDKELLLVLDLNGTLLHRCKDDGSRDYVPRPGVGSFLEYAFSTHKVMIWASAGAEAVNAMCQGLLAENQGELVAVWSRAHLRLPRGVYTTKTQVYKQLAWVWADDQIQRSKSEFGQPWSQKNTVLIDDGPEKGASEPHNIIAIDSFNGDPAAGDVFEELKAYLEELKMQTNVSSFMRAHPFRVSAQADS